MTLLNRRIYEQNDDGLFIFKCIEPMPNRETVLDTVVLTNVVKPKYRYSNVNLLDIFVFLILKPNILSLYLKLDDTQLTNKL